MVAEQTANTVDYDPVEILIPRGRGKEQGSSSFTIAWQLASLGGATGPTPNRMISTKF